ncbi:serine acetyltransferase [bacterium]|nr:serine acetyltransferase [bacterium]
MTQKRLKEVTEAILRSVMNKEVAVQHFDSSPLPDKESIYKIISDIFIILFPGYFGYADMSFDSIEMRISYRIARVYEYLKPQVYRELIHECRNYQTPCGMCDKASEAFVLEFLGYIPNLRKKLESDVKAAYKNDPAAGSFDEIIFSYPGLEAISVHRVANFFYNRGLRVIPRIMSEWAHSKTGVDIHPGATIGESFFIDHGTGVVIGETTVIGNNVTIAHGAIVHGCTLKDNVMIGMNAVVLDDAVVESFSIVAAGSVVTKGTVVQSGCVYAGIPAKKIKEVGPDLLDGEINRIAQSYGKYASWYKE